MDTKDIVTGELTELHKIFKSPSRCERIPRIDFFATKSWESVVNYVFQNIKDPFPVIVYKKEKDETPFISSKMDAVIYPVQNITASILKRASDISDTLILYISDAIEWKTEIIKSRCRFRFIVIYGPKGMLTKEGSKLLKSLKY